MSATTKSRLNQARKAVRPALKGRMMLSGPPGAGKTRTGLIIATELAEGGDVLGIDTEKESMLTYADDFDFTHLPWHPPFDAAELTQLLREASGQFAVILIDSFSHFWRGEGGVLDVAGGKFSGWKEARPLHEALLNSILEADSHVVLGVRSKIEYVQEVENGRHVVRKLGMSDQQDDNLSFEMNVAIDLSMDHVATVSKSRTTVLPVGRSYGVDRTIEMARAYREWLRGGEEPVEPEIAQKVTDRLNKLGPEQYRRKCKAEFLSTFGRPENLRPSVLDAVEGLLGRFENETPKQGGDSEGAGGKGSPATTEAHAQAGPSETDDAGEPAPESPPNAKVSGNPGANGSSDAPGPDTTPRLITTKQAQRLHVIAQGLDETVLRILTFSATNGQSDSANAVPVAKYDTVCEQAERAKGGELPNGYAEVADRYAAWLEQQAS